MSADTAVASLAEQIITQLPQATWDYNAETGRPLSVVIAPFDVWLAKQEGLSSLPPGVPLDLAAARRHLQGLLRASPQLLVG